MSELAKFDPMAGYLLTEGRALDSFRGHNYKHWVFNPFTGTLRKTSDIRIDPYGLMIVAPKTTQADDATEIVFGSIGISGMPVIPGEEVMIPHPFTVPGYEQLADVLERAYQQAAVGKGAQRHVNAGEPFHEQVMQIGAKRFGVGCLLFQAFKKSEESQRLPVDRAVAELLGAINYLAGAVIAIERDGL